MKKLLTILSIFFGLTLGLWASEAAHEHESHGHHASSYEENHAGINHEHDSHPEDETAHGCGCGCGDHGDGSDKASYAGDHHGDV